MMIPLSGSIEALALSAPIASGAEEFTGISIFEDVLGSPTRLVVGAEISPSVGALGSSAAARTAYTVYLDVCSLAYSMPARRISWNKSSADTAL